MISAVAQTLANLLTGGSSTVRTVQLDFCHPGMPQDCPLTTSRADRIFIFRTQI
ncbi:MAG: hypothetical protein MUF49_11280 [Oculatellaceae cyanobacterium Prado106]|nr:hypothetical protein [Oculatellaceae cyanobacterium Prado106]